jgi:small subunit ribosomal protein S14
MATTAKRAKDARYDAKAGKTCPLCAGKGEVDGRACITCKGKGKVFSTRQHNRCKLCGRPRAYLRKFGICRLCFRGLALRGEIPGVSKSSW